MFASLCQIIFVVVQGKISPLGTSLDVASLLIAILVMCMQGCARSFVSLKHSFPQNSVIRVVIFVHFLLSMMSLRVVNLETSPFMWAWVGVTVWCMGCLFVWSICQNDLGLTKFKSTSEF